MRLLQVKSGSMVIMILLYSLLMTLNLNNGPLVGLKASFKCQLVPV